MLADTGTTALVTLRGLVSHRESLDLQASASALLLTSAKVEGARDYSIAGKTFEYIAMRRPILAVVTDGAMRDLLRRTGLGVIVDPDDPGAVAQAIERVVSRPDRVLWPTPEQETFIATLHRERIAAQMAIQLREAAAEGYRG